MKSIFKTIAGEEILSSSNLISTVIKGRKGFSPNVLEFLNKHGNEIIISARIERNPIMAVIQKSLELISRKNIAYDKLFHLKLVVTTNKGNKIIIEKNENINVSNYVKTKDAESMPINEQLNISINELLENTKNAMGLSKFIKYSASSNNCQVFILNVLHANGIINPSYDTFIKQDTEYIFKNNPMLRKFANTITDLADRASIIIQGGNNKTNEFTIFRPI